MMIPIKDKMGNIIRMDTISNPYVSPFIDLNKDTRKKQEEKMGREAVLPTMEKDIPLGINIVPTSNDKFWKGKNPNQK